MRYILMTIQGPDHLEAWEASSPDEKRREVATVAAWFAEHGAAGRIVGGEELGWPREARTVRKRGITDGPFIETKEMLGGFIVVEVNSERRPSKWQPGGPASSGTTTPSRSARSAQPLPRRPKRPEATRPSAVRDGGKVRKDRR